MFVPAAQVMGASSWRIVFRHIAADGDADAGHLATLDFAFVMLAESALSFLGIGIQPPEITWGLMVAQGSNYLGQRLVARLLAGPRDHADHALAQPPLQLAAHRADPAQRWRLEIRGKGGIMT